MSEPATWESGEGSFQEEGHRRGCGTGGGILSPSHLHLFSGCGGPRAWGSRWDDLVSTRGSRIGLGEDFRDNWLGSQQREAARAALGPEQTGS